MVELDKGFSKWQPGAIFSLFPPPSWRVTSLWRTARAWASIRLKTSAAIWLPTLSGLDIT
jgi:hypothetical protein